MFYLAEIGVELHHTVAEFLHILSQELVSICDAVVQIAHFIVGVPSEIDTGKMRKILHILNHTVQHALWAV